MPVWSAFTLESWASRKRQRGAIVVTLDADFHMILGVTFADIRRSRYGCVCRYSAGRKSRASSGALIDTPHAAGRRYRVNPGFSVVIRVGGALAQLPGSSIRTR